MSSQAKIRIGVDIMGSDTSPRFLFQATETLARTLPQYVSIVALGTSEYAPKNRVPSNLTFREVSETIEMNEPPLVAIRRKRNSSLCVGMRMLKAKEIDAFVSAGNTGALVGSAKMTLGMLPGLNHPALLALMPTKLNPLAVLDVGANLECKAEHLVQLALIGSAYQKARGITLPSIGLLNIGSEAIKGTIELRSAYQKLEQLARQKDPFFKFSGNVEGKTVFDGTIDVLITDGFTGNVFLKTAEGIASLILDRLHEHLSKDSLEQLKGQLSDLQSHLHYAEYPGALLCGVAGIVIKCHGYSSPQAFTNAIREANRVVSENFFQILQKKLLRDCKTIN